MKGYIYKFENKINHKVYIGQTRQEPRTRYRQHIRDSEKDRIPFHCALRKYGKENFEFEIIEEIELENKQELITKLNELEISYIQEYGSLCPNGYNVEKGGNCYDIKTKIPKEFRDAKEYINEPIIDCNNKYKDILDYCIKTDSNYEFVFWDLVSPTKETFKKYHFINYKNIKYWGTTYPEDATIEDIILEKAIAYVKLPVNMSDPQKSEINDMKELVSKILEINGKILGILEDFTKRVSELEKQLNTV